MRVIVYGSLRRHQGNSRWMTHATWLGDYILDGYKIYDLGAYPAIVTGRGKVYCEIYRISSSILAELNILKSEEEGYKRELVQTPYGSAWLYLYQGPVQELPHITSGDWLERGK